MALSKFIGFKFSFTKSYGKIIKHTTCDLHHQNPGALQKSGLRSGIPLILPTPFLSIHEESLSCIS